MIPFNPVAVRTYGPVFDYSKKELTTDANGFSYYVVDNSFVTDVIEEQVEVAKTIGQTFWQSVVKANYKSISFPIEQFKEALIGEQVPAMFEAYTTFGLLSSVPPMELLLENLPSIENNFTMSSVFRKLCGKDLNGKNVLDMMFEISPDSGTVTYWFDECKKSHFYRPSVRQLYGVIMGAVAKLFDQQEVETFTSDNGNLYRANIKVKDLAEAFIENKVFGELTSIKDYLDMRKLVQNTFSSTDEIIMEKDERAMLVRLAVRAAELFGDHAGWGRAIGVEHIRQTIICLNRVMVGFPTNARPQIYSFDDTAEKQNLVAIFNDHRDEDTVRKELYSTTCYEYVYSLARESNQGKDSNSTLTVWKN